VAGTLTWWSLPTASLAGLRPHPSLRLRPAEARDVPAIRGAYEQTVLESAGMLDRKGPLFAAGPDEMLAEFDGVTIVDSFGGRVEGYASWERGRGYDENSTVSVYDLVGRTAEATRALLASLGTWRSVAPTLQLRLAEPDPAWLLAGMAGAKPLTRQPWMFRVVDARAAVRARGWPPFLGGSLDVALADGLCPWNAGRYRLELHDGSAQLVPGGSGAVELTPNGFALLYAGAATPALLRRAGLLSGGDSSTDAFLAAAFAGPPPALLDYF
jgi:predicted acetyltransferase